MQTRLQKILAQATELSRRSAEKAIKDGLVSVNGHAVTVLGAKADPHLDRITYRGKLVRITQPDIYIIFYKPRNTIVSKSDTHDRPTIWDSLPRDFKASLNSCGRLDFESEGLLLLTNDGRLIHKLTHPSSQIWKKYLVRVTGIPGSLVLERLQKGIQLEDGKTLPAQIKIIRQTDKNAALEIAIQEGKNRQIRRMFSAVGHPVRKLRRVEMGDLRLGNLKPGQYRQLNRKESAQIRRIR